MNSGPKGNVKEETDRKGLKNQHYGTVRPGSELKVPHFKEREDLRVQEDGRDQDDERGKRGGSQEIRSTGELKWTLSGFFRLECGFSAQRLRQRFGNKQCWEEKRKRVLKGRIIRKNV